MIAFLNRLVYKTAKNQVEALGQRQLGWNGGSNRQQQEIPRRMRERKAAVDIIIIVAAFLLCVFPMNIARLFRLFWKLGDVPAEAVQVLSSVFLISSLCNPIIYSVRKNEFRIGVKSLLRLCGLWKFQGDHNEKFIATNNLRFQRSIPGRNIMYHAAPLTDHASEDQHRSMFVSVMGLTRLKFESRLSPIPENAEEDQSKLKMFPKIEHCTFWVQVDLIGEIKAVFNPR